MRLLCLSLVLAVMAQLAHVVPAGAQAAPRAAALQDSADPLDQVAVDPTEGPLLVMLSDIGDTKDAMDEATRRADLERAAIDEELRSASLEQAALEAAQSELADRARATRLFDDSAQARERAARVGLDAINLRIAETEKAVADAAISAYMTGQENVLLENEDVPERLRKSIYANGVINTKTDLIADELAERRVYNEQLNEAAADLSKAQADLAGIGQLVLTIDARAVGERARIERSESQKAEIDDRLDMILGSLTNRLAGQNEQLRELRKTATVSGMDFPLVALDAYVSAAAAEETCGLNWEIIAGIGYVETRHGSWGGSEVGEDGVTTERIIGIPLNGRNRTMAIRDSDDGAFDGDTVWDRAVGPMQFIPTTWAILGRDGNGDGQLDPHNIYDAARSAAAHLCKNDARLTSDQRIRTAIFGYNRSTTYVNDVLRRARTYATLDI